MSLQGLCALVTGSTSGIGLAIANRLAQAGCSTLWLHGLGKEEELLKLQSDMQKKHQDTQILLSQLDMSNSKAILHSYEHEFSQTPIDILVNNAGIQHVSPVLDFPLDQWHKILDINLTACFLTTQKVLPHMMTSKFGRIVNVASVHGLVASKNKSAYVAAKHGLVGFTKATALECAGSGVTINAVCPGFVRTPLVEKQIEARAEESMISMEEAARALLGEKQPSGQFVTEEEIGSTVNFLCSKEAAQINGISLPVDGGWTIQ